MDRTHSRGEKEKGGPPCPHPHPPFLAARVEPQLLVFPVSGDAHAQRLAALPAGRTNHPRHQFRRHREIEIWGRELFRFYTHDALVAVSFLIVLVSLIFLRAKNSV